MPTLSNTIMDLPGFRKVHFPDFGRVLCLAENCVFKLIASLLLVFSSGICQAQGPNPQTGMRVTGLINLSGSCERDTLRMENLTKDSAKTVKFYVHSYNYFNNPLYPNYKDT